SLDVSVGLFAIWPLFMLSMAVMSGSNIYAGSVLVACGTGLYALTAGARLIFGYRMVNTTSLATGIRLAFAFLVFMLSLLWMHLLK
ncbi:MAG TPA: hypothetical protein VG269_29355, partial [Tepidisphaeraceae bacterium]|nr:hypothetical protein [Tepidisphaeraceae bacterium]